MSLEKKLDEEVNLDLLIELSFPRCARNLIRKFEKYFGKNPAELDFYRIYLRYLKCNSLYRGIFNSDGTIKKRVYSLSSLKLSFDQFKLLESYLFSKEIIKEKLFETDK